MTATEGFYLAWIAPMMIALIALIASLPVPCDAQSNQPAAAFYDARHQWKSAKKSDPYHYERYADFRAMISQPGGWGILYIGVPDTPSVGTYQSHCRVPSGFQGLADGVWDCWYDAEGKRPAMAHRPDPVKPVDLGLPGGPVQDPPPLRMEPNPAEPYRWVFRPPYQYRSV